MTTIDYNQVFQSAYEQLNPEQRRAVDLINGPVMALAGPGTGKTQLLAVRIGNILRQTDASAGNILALTFTDAGAHAMRKRLKTFIGTDAYNVTISTFHSFCNQVVQENIEKFGNYRDLQTVSDLETVDVLRKVIDGFNDDHPLKRLKGDPYLDLRKIKHLFLTMKRENWTEEILVQEVEDLKERMQVDPDYIYKRKTSRNGVTFMKGDLNVYKMQADLEKFDALLAASKGLTTYNTLLQKMDRFDYSDMIAWVLEAFKSDTDLLADYQERYQYILVDEYQDTNGAQNDLVFTLASFWDQPNLFVVGDDDQSIYRFQGANMNNIASFIDTFSPEIIVLEKNYRSTEAILNAATQLIDNNIGRIAKQYGIKKRLIPGIDSNLGGDRPHIQVYANPTQEEIGIIRQIMDLHKAGVPYKEIGVLYPKHSHAKEMIRYLTQQGVPINVKKKVNVLNEIDVRRLLDIFRYITKEYKRNNDAEEQLFEIMHFDFFQLKSRDIGKISLFCSQGRRDETKEVPYRWRDVIGNKELLERVGVDNIEATLTCASKLESWIDGLQNYTLQVFFEKVLTESGLLDEILNDQEQSWRVQVINTLFDFVKNESAKRPELTLSDLLDMVDKMEENYITLDLVKVTFNKEGVNFMTIHGSKGLEFDHVFVMRSNSEEWEKKRKGGNQSFTFPQQKCIDGVKELDLEEQRRLFFVALTRARHQVYISFPAKSNEDKDLTPSQFVLEIEEDESLYQTLEVKNEAVLLYSAELLRYQSAMPSLIDHELIDKELENFKVSSTSLNKYLRCPIAFYFENILRVPSARGANTGYGNAIHWAMERFFLDVKNDPQMSIPSVDVLIQYFYQGMDRFSSHFTMQEYQNLKKHGSINLKAYYEKYHGRWTGMRSLEAEYKIDQTAYQDVPITGLLDKVEVYDNEVLVVDYKTGKPDSQGNRKKLKPPTSVDDSDPGGDYWRQIVFYRLLIDGDSRQNWKMNKGVMDFVEPDKKDDFIQKVFEVEPLDLEIVGGQLVDTYNKIKNHKFEEGCRDENCRWCNFVANNEREAKKI
jgi:DNA helicase-2/ATP-dependent DNA helicase PcrA